MCNNNKCYISVLALYIYIYIYRLHETIRFEAQALLHYHHKPRLDFIYIWHSETNICFIKALLLVVLYEISDIFGKFYNLFAFDILPFRLKYILYRESGDSRNFSQDVP